MSRIYSDNKDYKKKVVIIGSGLVGTTTALLFSKLGFHVYVFEKRPAVLEDHASDHILKRSINLALSWRGQETLKKVVCYYYSCFKWLL